MPGIADYLVIIVMCALLFMHADIYQSLVGWSLAQWFHHPHLPIYNIKRSTVNMYKIDRGIDRSGPGVKKFAPCGSVRVRTPRRGSVKVRSRG